MIFNVAVAAPLRPLGSFTCNDAVHTFDGTKDIEIPNVFYFYASHPGEGSIGGWRMWILASGNLKFDFINKPVDICGVGRGGNGGSLEYQYESGNVKWEGGGAGGGGGQVLTVENRSLSIGATYTATVDSNGTSLKQGDSVIVAPANGGGGGSGIGPEHTDVGGSGAPGGAGSGWGGRAAYYNWYTGHSSDPRGGGAGTYAFRGTRFTSGDSDFDSHKFGAGGGGGGLSQTGTSTQPAGKSAGFYGCGGSSGQSGVKGCILLRYKP